MRMPWKVFGLYAVWKLKVNKINCLTWNSLKSWFRPLEVRFFCLCMFFNLSLSVNNKLVNNMLVNHLEKYRLSSDFQYGFGSSQSTADLLTVVSDRTEKAFNRSGATWAVALDISKAFDRVWDTGLLCKLKSYGISGQIFGLMALSGSGPEVLTRIQSYCWSLSRLRSWTYSFPAIHKSSSWWCYL